MRPATPTASGTRLDDERYHYETQCTEGKVDVKDPAPSGVLSDDSADQRSANRPGGPGKLQYNVIFRSLSERNDIRGNNKHQHDNSPTSDTLDGPPSEKLREIVGETTDEGADCKKQH
ncbi:MAG: hypothetical protein LQ342_007447 [Letrouitia transgressa]|nr:MAG: hypothetical protein LQ342_007447 [Letrouitia transgressa]